MLCPNMELADKTDESALDMTAAEIAPSPMNETHEGERYCKTIGNTRRVSPITCTPSFSTNKPASKAPGISVQSSDKKITNLYKTSFGSNTYKNNKFISF